MSSVVLVPGLKVDVDGTSDEQGRVVAKTITVDGDDLESAQMIEAGLAVTINSDDPPMFGTTLDREYLLVATHFGLSPGDLKRLSLAGLEAAWLDDLTRETWISAWSREIDLLIETELAPAAR